MSDVGSRATCAKNVTFALFNIEWECGYLLCMCLQNLFVLQILDSSECVAALLKLMLNFVVEITYDYEEETCNI